jgi:alpha-mannosidase
MSQNTASPFEKYKSTLETIDQHIFTSINDLTVDAWKTNEPVPYADRKTGEHRSLSLGDRWGDLFDSAWMRFTGEIPANISGGRRLFASLTSAEKPMWWMTTATPSPV